MGAWGGGLYDGDFALDLKGTIEGVLRAPFSDEEVLAEIWGSHGKSALDVDALDYWLVLADQGGIARGVGGGGTGLLDGGGEHVVGTAVERAGSRELVGHGAHCC